MNKQIVEREINIAYKELEKTEIAENGIINSSYRGQISSLGAAIEMGSLSAAIAFFSTKGNSQVERPKLVSCIFNVIQSDSKYNWKDKYKDIVEFIEKNSDVAKEVIINAAIAIKLAMNLYVLED